ncbi:hypothetical protein FAF44_47175 [Nonomuraea sp. MG754425]|uniref:DUF4344 domain-containing metallopeptidase n=1 Tax=Nonomuraea sp. MG754425 TaxID=2570319 RepID=UPI001F1C8529|nr:DUF4344 domain-containing metallopeptidase [Nonomuraea sp. MG754425]MCF6475872.1 hypothetical protein [Nonomuraea sp. MG754425]
MPHPVIALALSMTSTLAAAPSAEPSVRYESPDSPRAERAERLLKDDDVLKTGIRLPEPVKIVARDCDAAKARWDHDKREITICYSLVDKVRETIKGISQTEEIDEKATRARMKGALTVLLHHQLGHALTTLNGMPDDEGQADRFAALTLAADSPKRVVAAAEARHLLAGHAGIDHLSGPEGGDPEKSGMEESAAFACLLYGADPARYGKILKGGWVPAERAPTCADEYNRVKSAIGDKFGS